MVSTVCIPTQERGNENLGVEGSSFPRSCVGTHTERLENLNAVFIHEGLSQSERLPRLNQIAISQMKILLQDRGVKRLEVGDE